MSYSWNAPACTVSGPRAKKVEIARTFELLVQPAPACYAQGTNELLEVDMTILVLIEDVEDVVGKFARVAEWEELLVYPTELGLVQLP